MHWNSQNGLFEAVNLYFYCLRSQLRPLYVETDENVLIHPEIQKKFQTKFCKVSVLYDFVKYGTVQYRGYHPHTTSLKWLTVAMTFIETEMEL